MSKIIVDEIQTDTVDGNVRIIPNGIGKLEVKGAGGDDAMLQLNCSAQSHGVKLKSPNHTSAQSYTMILPDNNIEAGKFLKVKSIASGSGNSAVGQLEYSGVNVFDPNVLQESFHNDTNAITGTFNHDILTNGMIWNGSANASGPFTFNIRGNASTTFDSLLVTGKSTVMTLFSANNASANYMSALQIDGVSQTIKWAGGTAPTAATGSGVDVYSITIMKTASSTYSVFGNFTNFA